MKKIVQRRSNKNRKECIASKANLALLPAFEETLEPDCLDLNSDVTPNSPVIMITSVKSLCLLPHFAHKNGVILSTQEEWYGLKKILFVVQLKLCLGSDKCCAFLNYSTLLRG